MCCLARNSSCMINTNFWCKSAPPNNMSLAAVSLLHSFVVLQGASKQHFEDLTLELIGKKMPEEKAKITLERMAAKKEKTWPRVSRKFFGANSIRA